MSLEYLSKYLNKDEKPKKRKRGAGTSIVKDDDAGWSFDGVRNGATEEETDGPTIVKQEITRSAGFKPAYVGVKSEDVQGTVKRENMMQNGLRAGLLSKQDMQASLANLKAADHAATDKVDAASSAKHQETIYRDATGKRIDIALARQEKARDAKREAEKKRREEEMSKGLVQQRERRAQAQALEAVHKEGFSRYAGDAQAEAALKAKRQWNDPAAAFLPQSAPDSLEADTGNRPVYKGGFAPNRFAIRPGYRWDGVDRSNGYEAKRFKALAATKQRKSEYDEWAREDM